MNVIFEGKISEAFPKINTSTNKHMKSCSISLIKMQIKNTQMGLWRSLFACLLHTLLRTDKDAMKQGLSSRLVGLIGGEFRQIHQAP